MGPARAVRLLLAAIASLAIYMGSAAAAEQLRIVTDEQAAIEIGIPESWPAEGKPTKWGHTWASPDGGMMVNSLAFAPGRSIEDVYAKLIAINGRVLTEDTCTAVGQFVLRGRDADGSGFYINARLDRDTVRGFSVIYNDTRKHEYYATSRQIAQTFELLSGAVIYRRREVKAVAISADGKLALSGHPEGACPLILWDVASGKKLRSFSGVVGEVTSVTFSPDGKKVAAIICEKEWGKCVKNYIKLWDASSRRELLALNSKDNIAKTLAFSQDDTFALTGGNEDYVPKLWDVVSGREVRSFFPKDWKLSGKTCWIYDNGRLVDGVLQGDWCRVRRKGLFEVVFSPDGKRALSASQDGSVTVWEVDGGRELSWFHLEKYVKSIALSPDGRLALSSSSDGPVKLWEVGSGRELRSLGKSYASVVTFSADSKLACAVNFTALTVWDVASGQ